MTRITALLLIAVSIGACTSTLAIGTAYNSAANRFNKELLSYADFTAPQEKSIRNRTAAFHQWHRENQLSQYRALLLQVITALESPGDFTVSNATALTDSARELVKGFSQCSPLNQSGNFLKSLTDRQVEQIAQKIRDKHTERVKEYRAESAADRQEKRTKAFEKWMGRAGVPLNTEQRELLTQTLAKQISLSPRRHALWKRWSDQLLEKLEHRNDPGFMERVNTHIASLWNMTERHYPQEWQANISLWEEFLTGFVQRMTTQQSQQLSEKLGKLSNSLAKLAAKPAKVNAQCFGARQ